MARILIFLLLGLFVGQAMYYFSALPEHIASHFDGAGNPDGWMSRSSFFGLQAVLLVLLVTEFLVLPYIIERMPDSLINIPNKHHWLSVERRRETFGTIRRYLEWFAVATLTLFLFVNQLLYTANIEHKNLSGPWMWTILIVYFLFVIVWLIKFAMQFRVKS